MKVTLDQNTIQSMNLFQNLTGAPVVDCISDEDNLYFIVAKGKYGFAVGKNGAKIKNAERVFKKGIKVFEYADAPKDFIRNIIPDAQDISQSGGIMIVRIKPSDRARIIGKAGRNIKILSKFLQRLFGLDELKVR